MSIVKIDYDKLGKISSHSKKTANEMQDYIDDLTKKISNKYSDLNGGSSSKTNNSSYYVNQKISRLKAKKTQYSNFSTDVSNFVNNAKDLDREVSKKITTSKNDFVDKHDYVDVNWWTEMKEFFIDLKNSCPLFEAIGNLINKTIEGMKNLFAEIKHWYKCGGGKEILGIVLAGLGAIAAVCLAIAACVPPICGIVAVCAAIGAVITALNAVVNVVTSIEACIAKSNGDPAWAKIYSDRNTMQDSLRERNWGNGTLNKLSYYAATAIDVTQLVCDVVAIYDGIKHVQNTFRELKKYANQSRTRNFGQIFKDYLFNKKNYNGKKMRNLIQERAHIRTLRNYKSTKAMSIAQYEKSLTNAQKFAKKLTNFSSKKITPIKNFVEKNGKFLNGDKFSFSQTAEKQIQKQLKKYQIPKTIFKVKDLYGDSKKVFSMP